MAPALGHVLAGLVVIGGLVYNVGNMAGTGLGTDAMVGLNPKVGGAVSAVVAIAIVTGPPVGQALKNSVWPDQVDFLVTGLMRVVLFLAVFGVVAGGAVLDKAHPLASGFLQGAGEVGLRLFGVILWAAAITSVSGASYTSVSFITRSHTPVTRSHTPERTRNLWTVGFIVVCLIGYLTLGQAPATLPIFAGAFNGLILPLGFAIVLWVAWQRRDLLHGYAYSRWLLVIGVLAWLLPLYLGWNSLSGLSKLWAG